ncbi:efflux RND transporter periplasmic adaptor subunit [Pseudomonas monteilii]|nr:efflux RND transporter periplasmic adaptor subunit [Pseudomonas monteilii]
MGSLINVGMVPGSELFVVADISKLRVYVDVPQRQVALVKHGDRAILQVPDRPGQQFTAVVNSSARAFNASSDAMRVQLIVDNDGGELFPGSYGTVTFSPTADVAGVGIPPSALIFNGKGTQIATLGADQKVVLQPVVIARDYGTVIQLEGVIDEDLRLINSPPDGLQNGQLVEIAKRAEVPSP